MVNRNLLISISLVLLWTSNDLQRSYKKQTSSIISNDRSTNLHQVLSILPPPSLSTIKTQTVSTIKFRYCHTCGYRNMFEQFSQVVRKNYPTMNIVEEKYPPLPLQGLLARIFSMTKIALLVCLLFGQNPFLLFNLPTPKIYLWALQHKMYACLMIFFVSNSIESYLVSTGAFEISIDNAPLWSKLGAGRLPSATELLQMLQTFTNSTNSTD